MQSKRSFFNGTLFRKNLSRSWPLWGLLSLTGALAPLYILLELLQRRSVSMPPDDFAASLYNVVTLLAPGFTAAYALICALAVWGYLYNARSAGMFHALPVNRTCLFITNTVSGLVMILIPYAIVGFLVCLIAACWGFFHFMAVLNTIIAVLLLTVTFYGIATLCAMLTGHLVMLPALYILVNFLAPLLESLILSLADQFLIGINGDGISLVLSPICEIYTKFRCRLDYSSPLPADYSSYAPVPESVPALTGLWIVALYALAGLVLLALAWFLYKKRHVECAGDVVAFRWMRPIFRYGVALLSGLTLGRLLYELLWRELFQRGDYADVLPMFICTTLTALLGYYAASMLIAKSKRVFRGSLKGVGIVCAGAAALMLLVSTDVFGVESRIPSVDEISSVSLVDRGENTGCFDPAENPKQVEAILAFHQAVINDRNYIRSYAPDWNVDEGKVFNHYISVDYQLKDGSTLCRSYDLWFTADRAAQSGTYEARLIEFLSDPEVRRQAVVIPEDALLLDLEIYNPYSEETAYTTVGRANADVSTIYDALLQDADEGNIPARAVLSNNGLPSDFWLALNYQVPSSPWDGTWDYGYARVYLYPEMTNTVETLQKLNYITEADITRWKYDYELNQSGSSYMEVVNGW